MSSDASIEIYEKMPGESEALFYKLCSYNRIGIPDYEINLEFYTGDLAPLFNKIRKEKRETGLYNDCAEFFNELVCLNFDELIEVVNIVKNSEKYKTELLYSVTNLVESTESLIGKKEEPNNLFNDCWVVLNIV